MTPIESCFLAHKKKKTETYFNNKDNLKNKTAMNLPICKSKIACDGS